MESTVFLFFFVTQGCFLAWRWYLTGGDSGWFLLLFLLVMLYNSLDFIKRCEKVWEGVGRKISECLVRDDVPIPYSDISLLLVDALRHGMFIYCNGLSIHGAGPEPELSYLAMTWSYSWCERPIHYQPKPIPSSNTVDGRHPARVDMVNIPFLWIFTSQVVSRISSTNRSNGNHGLFSNAWHNILKWWMCQPTLWD